MRLTGVFLIAVLYGINAQAEQPQRQPTSQKESSSNTQGAISDQQAEEDKEEDDDDTDLDEIIEDMNDEGENDMFYSP